MIDPKYRPLTFSDYVYWGIFLTASVVVAQLLLSLIDLSFREETVFLQEAAINRKIAATNVALRTSAGKIVIRLMRPQAPVASNVLSQLVQSGFYDGTKFHRVEPGMLIGGGDPLSREKKRELWGTGGPGYVFEDENLDAPMVRGTVALENRGKPDTNGSQIFIVVADEAPELEGKYTVVGRVIGGMDVVDRIAAGKLAEDGMPENPVVIREARIEK